MEENYKKLIEKFESISKLKWVKGINANKNSVGLTFENLLGKKVDSCFFPDYQGIEIKCTQRYSGFPIKLFSLAFDGPSFYEMNELVNKYGKKDFIYKDKKIINAELPINQKTLYNKYYFKLKVSKNEEKLCLQIYKFNGLILDRISYINFSTIKNHLEVKLSNMALIWASKKNIQDYPYFRYYKICIYKLKSFERFLELIEKGVVLVSINGNISRTGEDKGRLRNQNLIFKIPKEEIEELFDLQIICDKDRNYFIDKSSKKYIAKK